MSAANETKQGIGICWICCRARQLREIDGVQVCMEEVSEAEWELAGRSLHTSTSEGLDLPFPMTTQQACELGIDLYGER
jgi:hypothetical protein